MLDAATKAGAILARSLTFALDKCIQGNIQYVGGETLTSNWFNKTLKRDHTENIFQRDDVRNKRVLIIKYIFRQA